MSGYLFFASCLIFFISDIFMFSIWYYLMCYRVLNSVFWQSIFVKIVSSISRQKFMVSGFCNLITSLGYVNVRKWFTFIIEIYGLIHLIPFLVCSLVINEFLWVNYVNQWFVVILDHPLKKNLFIFLFFSYNFS